MVSNLTHPSIIAVASVSEHFLMVSRGVLGPVVGSQHTLIECLLTGQETTQIPTADMLFCDSIVFARLSAPQRRKNTGVYCLVSRECLDQIAAAMAKLVSAPQARPVNTKAADLSLDAELISGKLRDRGLPSSTIRQVIAVLGGEGR